MSLRTDLWQRGRDHLELGVTWSCPLRQSQQMPTLFASSEKNVQWIKVVTNDSIATCSSALYIFPFWNFRHRLVRLYWYTYIISKPHMMTVMCICLAPGVHYTPLVRRAQDSDIVIPCPMRMTCDSHKLWMRHFWRASVVRMGQCCNRDETTRRKALTVYAYYNTYIYIYYSLIFVM